MARSLSATASDADAGTRLDVFVARAASFSRAEAGRLVDGGHVLVDGQKQRKSYKVAAGDVVEVAEPPAPIHEPPTGVEVVYDDDHLLVVSKPSGVVVHAGRGVRTGTLVDALRAHGYALAQRGGETRPGIVHRLDRDVSGLLVVAKTDEAHERLAAAMKARQIERRYVALVNGSPEIDRGKIDAPVGRDPKHRARMAVVPEGRPSVTLFAVTQRFDGTALLDVTLETGRTHQIRTHLASIGHPIVGDAVYGRDPTLARRLELRRPFLHAYLLGLHHPVTGADMKFEDPLPHDLEAALARIQG